jgi:hypothetical protein
LGQGVSTVTGGSDRSFITAMKQSEGAFVDA